jgi:hypothetical protein
VVAYPKYWVQNKYRMKRKKWGWTQNVTTTPCIDTMIVTAATATLLSRDSELLDAQVESCRDEQESERETPRGVRLKVSTLKGP